MVRGSTSTDHLAWNTLIIVIIIIIIIIIIINLLFVCVDAVFHMRSPKRG